MSVFEAWEKPAVTWTCRLGSKRCRCAMAPAIGTARPVCVEKLYRIAKGAWDDGDDFGLVDEVVGVACEATYAMRNATRSPCER